MDEFEKKMIASLVKVVDAQNWRIIELKKQAGIVLTERELTADVVKDLF